MRRTNNTCGCCRFGLAVAAALVLAAFALPLHPAEAALIGVHVAPVSVGVGPYYPYYPYYRPGQFDHPYQNRHYYYHYYWFDRV